MECKMMHDIYAKIDAFFEGFIKVNCKHCRETWFYLKIANIFPTVPFSKVRTKPRKNFLTKVKALVKIFEVVFLGVLPYKFRSSAIFARNFPKSFNI